MVAEATENSLAALAGRYGLGSAERRQLGVLLGNLERDEHAPTSIHTASRALEVHLADSLSALDFDEVRAARSIADLGSGAGFPGLPLAVALPSASVRLVESQRRKCDFLTKAAAAASLDSVIVIHARAEAWADGIEAQDLIVARALGPQSVVLEYAAPLLSIDGLLLDWRGRRDPKAESESASAAQELGFELVEVRRVVPFEEARDHHLHLYVKVRETPERFPRRPGIARKRPLGICA